MTKHIIEDGGFRCEIPKGNPPLTRTEEMEYGFSPKVTEAIELILEPLPSLSEEMDIKQVEEHLGNLRDIHYMAAKLKRQGKSYREIGRIIGTDSSTAKIFVDRVLHLHWRLFPKQAELISQEVIEQLDDLYSFNFHEAAKLGQFTGPNEDEVYLNSGQIDTALKILDRKIKILGIESPKRVVVELADEVTKAQAQLKEKLNSYRIIDVTPKSEKVAI